jgi:predicted RNA-binding Zn ribbon-like protein
MDESESESTHFEFSGGVICLDFCNTADGDINGEWKENLLQYEDLITWSREARTLNEAEAEQLLRSAAEHSAESNQVMEKAHGLRKTLYDVFSAIAHEEQPQAAHLATFNTFLGETGAQLQIVPAPDGFEWTWAQESLEKPLWPITWSAAELLLSNNRTLVRECGNPTCSWLFLDTSRNHSRRWCDMKGCGNRAKARRHYARIKAAQ